MVGISVFIGGRGGLEGIRLFLAERGDRMVFMGTEGNQSALTELKEGL